MNSIELQNIAKLQPSHLAAAPTAEASPSTSSRRGSDAISVCPITLLTRQECGDDLFLSESDKPHFYSKTAIKAWYRDHNESPLTRQVARQDILALWPDGGRAFFRPHAGPRSRMGTLLLGGVAAPTLGLAGFFMLVFSVGADQPNLLAAGITVSVGAGVCICAAIALARLPARLPRIDGQDASARAITLPPLVQNEEPV